MTKTAKDRGGNHWRIVGWSLAGLLLMLPLVAGAPWTASDYAFAVVLFGTVGAGIEFAVARSGNLAYRAAMISGLVAAFAVIWVNAAVGIIGSTDDPWNIMFAGVLVVAFAGSVIVGFRARAMAWVMGAAAAGQVTAACVGIGIDPHGGMFAAVLTLPWIASVALFALAARQNEATT